MNYSSPLNDLQNSSADVQGAMLINREGKLLGSSASIQIYTSDVENAAKHCAEALAIALDLASLTARGNLDQAYIKGQSGYVIVMPVDATMLLVTLASAEAKLGLIFLDMGRVARGLYGDMDSPMARDPIFPPQPPKRGRGYARPG